jgi:hypothetical protein
VSEVYGSVLVVVLSTWFVCSVAFQFEPQWLATLKAYDHFALLPCWTFFAPRPATTDAHLLFRDRLCDGGMTPWRELPERRPRLRWLWHPQKRAAKTLRDLESHLLLFQTVRYTREQICLSMPYVLLINYIATLPRTNISMSTQFTIVRSMGYWGGADSAALFVSELHSIRETDDAGQHRVSWQRYSDINRDSDHLPGSACGSRTLRTFWPDELGDCPYVPSMDDSGHSSDAAGCRLLPPRLYVAQLDQARRGASDYSGKRGFVEQPCSGSNFFDTGLQSYRTLSYSQSIRSGWVRPNDSHHARCADAVVLRSRQQAGLTRLLDICSTSIRSGIFNLWMGEDECSGLAIGCCTGGGNEYKFLRFKAACEISLVAHANCEGFFLDPYFVSNLFPVSPVSWEVRFGAVSRGNSLPRAKRRCKRADDTREFRAFHRGVRCRSAFT